MYWLLQVSVLYLYLPVCLAFFAYKDKLPNSDNVQHPCVAVYKWPGVGHEHKLGGGNRNVFGQDFAKAGHKWTKALCTADSDGDGRTNGEELGDPSCVWSVGQEPSRTVNITHPGICEPLHDVTCHGKNNFVSCEVDTFDTCDVIKSPDIKTLDLVMPNLIIPPTVTNDLCLTFDLPDDQDYHMVAYEAIIDTPNIVHHMDMYGCEKDENFILESPKPCDMSMKACSTEISGWMIGMSGLCYGDNLAYSIGKSGYKRFRLEIHYHNPNLEHGHQDSSGMRIYYRPARPGVQELFTLPVGQLFLELPPGQSRVERTGVFTESCTAQMFKEPVYVIFGYNHMHLTGRSERVEVFRNGQHIANLTDDQEYDFNMPVYHNHNPPIQLLPGDKIVTRCFFNTSAIQRWTFFGEATTDEMCLANLHLYPRSALNFEAFPTITGLAEGDLSFCDLSQGTPFKGCNWASLVNPEKEDFVRLSQDLYDNCNLDGFCRPECKEVIQSIVSSPCFQGETAKFVKTHLAKTKPGLEVLVRLQSCSVNLF